MDVLSGFPVGHPSWEVPPWESGSRGASRGACRASRETLCEVGNAPRTVPDREKYLFCFIFYKVIKKSGVTLFVGTSRLTASKWGYFEREK